MGKEHADCRGREKGMQKTGKRHAEVRKRSCKGRKKDKRCRYIENCHYEKRGRKP
jgi:hypothetical protein